MAEAAGPASRGLPAWVKAGFSLGDHTINVQLAAVSLFFLYFLTEVAGLPPAWAGLVLWIGRAFDAVSDPAMGRISDQTRWRAGRRRPWFLIGAVPFGVTFALLWSTPPGTGALAAFAFYAAVYVANTLSSTVLAVPCMALLPELALDYDERTSLNTWRTLAAFAGVLLVAVAMPEIANTADTPARGFALAGWCFGVWVALPWLVVFAVTWERPGFARPSALGFLEGSRRITRHPSFRRLVGLFLPARIALDLVGAMLLFYFTHWLRRPEDFQLALLLLLATVMCTLPLWLRLARRLDKRTVFVAAVLWWAAAQALVFAVQPDTPRSAVFALLVLAGVGYGVADLMPWSMLGDVIDEDELVTDERRDGAYTGFLTFLRKLGGASGVAIAGVVLQLCGWEPGAPVQAPLAVAAVRWLTAVVPAAALLVAAGVALRYPIGRARHAEIRAALGARRRRS